MEQCPKCESELTGRTCVCGYEQPMALRVGASASDRRWRLCEWVPAPGRLCQAPAGIIRTDGAREERLCAYHQHRARLSLYGAFISEERAFLDWVEQFPPGTRYQPMPGIWDGDREQLWRLLSGEIEWASFLSDMRSRKVGA